MFSFSRPLESVSEGRVRVSSDVRGWAGDNVTLECRVTGAGQPVVIWLRRRDTDTAASAQEVVAHGAEVLVPELDRVRASVAASPALYTSTLTVGDAVYNHKIPPCRFR